MTVIYMHRDDRPISINNIFCIGRNYAAHIAELGNDQQDSPLVFLKPNSALKREGSSIVLPSHKDLISSSDDQIHYETELILLIGKGGKHISPEIALTHIDGYGIGLDLTHRGLQTLAKKNGWPWAISKGFDHSACVSNFLIAKELDDPLNTFFEMHLNGIKKQQGKTSMMLFDIPYLVHYLSSVFTLTPGDLIFTGTPEGVGCLNSGDVIALNLANKLYAHFIVG